MTKVLKIILTILLTGIVMSGCTEIGDRQPLPTGTSPYASFGANDTTYIRLLPDWDTAQVGYNFNHPVDIAIGRDGYLFVLDQGNDQVAVFNKSGKLQNHSGLNNIIGVSNPEAIAIDSKMNLFLVNGTNKIYVWNQYLNYSGVDSVAVQYVLRDTLTNELFDFNYSQAEEAILDSTMNVVLERIVFSDEAVLRDSLLSVSVFYEDASSEAQFSGVTAAPFGRDYIYVADRGKNRILRIDVVASGLVKLRGGWLNLVYSGIYNRAVSSYGSGAGSVDAPRSVTTDGDGNIYFTQTGGNFLVQKLSYRDFNSVFILNEHPIMDLTEPPQFVFPADISVDDNSFIYVLEKLPYTRIRTNPDATIDSTLCYVHKFSPDGRIVDLGITGIAVAEFNEPQGIAVDDEGIIYIANTGANRIERFKLSISDEDIPKDPQ